MRSTLLNPADAETIREGWKQAVEALMADVRTWAEEQGWGVEQTSHDLTEGVLGTYSASGLEIRTPQGEVILEPVGRNVMGSEGRVDFYAWPTHIRVLLLRKPGRGWTVGTEFGPAWPHPWGRDTFVELARALWRDQ